MMGTKVTFEFSDLDDAIVDFKQEKRNADTKKSFIRTAVCFSSYSTDRKEFERKDTGVFYTLRCNVFYLIKLLSWMNKVSNGMKFTLIASKTEDKKGDTKFYYYKSEKNNIEYEKSTVEGMILVDNVDEIDKKKFNDHYCLVQIHVDMRHGESKINAEYMVLTIIRMLDLNEEWRAIWGKKEIQQEIIDMSNNANNGHSIAETHIGRERGLKDNFLTTEFLVHLLDVNVMNKVKGLYRPAQTIICAIVFEIVYNVKLPRQRQYSSRW